MKALLKILYCAAAFLLLSCGTSRFSTFITSRGDKLYDGEKEFRFVSFNVPNLHYIEDYLRFDAVNPWRLPDEFEIRDALTSIKQIGGRVARTYVITVKRDIDPAGMIKHVEAPGEFNEEAFIALDKVLEIANETGIRLIIPFVDNWHWMGGKAEYAAFRGKEPEEFWTDSLLISDFKKTVEFVLNRKNTFTGIPYKDDKSILGWETGNELECPFSWTSEIAAYIKSIDKNHLVIEGTYSGLVSAEAVQDTNLDVLSTHYYEPAGSAIPKIIYNRKMTEGVKPYFVGEFGFIPSEEFQSIIDTVINNDISGALLWSLRFRNREGGFYKHYEKSGFSAYNWPGFAFNKSYNEKAVLNMIKNKAHEISGNEKEPLPRPAAPVLLPAKSVYEISWQGSTGAVYYIIQRKEEKAGDWITIDVADDVKIAYRPLFADLLAERGKSYYYRIAASNGIEESDYSNAIGPIQAGNMKIIDEMFDDRFILYKTDGLNFLSMEDVRQAKEDRSRLAGSDSSSIIYEVSPAINSLQVDAFLKDTSAVLRFYVANDLENFREIYCGEESFASGKNDYGFFIPVRYSYNVSLQTKYLKIELTEGIQISRVEIEIND